MARIEAPASAKADRQPRQSSTLLKPWRTKMFPSALTQICRFADTSTRPILLRDSSATLPPTRNPEAARLVVAAGALLLMSMTVEAQVNFSRVTTDPELGRFDFIVTVADINGDDRDDIVVGGREEHKLDGVPEDRFAKVPFHILVGKDDGGFMHAPELVDGTIHAREAYVATSDFNGDGRMDLAVFDYGVYVWDGRAGYGNPPELWLSSHDGVLRPSEALAEAVRAAHAEGPSSAGKGISAPADLHLKSVTSGDIDGDKDSDLWVDSIGGKNVSSHFMVNNGDGTFTVDEARAPPALRYNPPDSWYHVEGQLVDLDNDNDLDLSLGHNRHTEDPFKRNSFSIVLLNDATGNYPARIELAHPSFNEGYTLVRGQTHFDVNSDGFQDLLLLHTRNPYGNPDVLPFTGRYIQVLINDQGTSFVDETSTRMGDQSATTAMYESDGVGLYNDGKLSMHDVDRDGCADIVVSKSWGIGTPGFPLVYRNNGSGQFTAMDPRLFAGDDRYFGAHIVPVHVNGDGAIDFVVPQRDDGPDDEWGSEDDFTTLVTLLNTTPAGPVRCSPRVTAVGTLPAQTLNAGADAVVVSVADAFQDALTYQASSSASGVATVGVAGSDVTVTPVAAGVATITVTASGADNSIATQQFKVTVLVATTVARARPILAGESFTLTGTHVQ